jgi:hypothetical protein
MVYICSSYTVTKSILRYTCTIELRIDIYDPWKHLHARISDREPAANDFNIAYDILKRSQREGNQLVWIDGYLSLRSSAQIHTSVIGSYDPTNNLVPNIERRLYTKTVYL